MDSEKYNQNSKVMQSTKITNKRLAVEVFRTNVDSEELTQKIILYLQRIFPTYRVNFDLDDCDRILRVEPSTGHVDIEGIKQVVRSFNREIEALQ